MRNLKKRFERYLARNSKKRGFSIYVQSRWKNKENIGPLTLNGELIHDEERICDVLNNFFASVHTSEQTDTLPQFDILVIVKTL